MRLGLHRKTSFARQSASRDDHYFVNLNRSSDATDNSRMSLHSPILRTIALASGAAGTLFWIYTFYWISKLPPGDGTGFQWIAEVPLTAIFVFLTFPAVVLAISRRTAWLGAILGVANLIAFGVIWSQLMTEFAH